MINNISRNIITQSLTASGNVAFETDQVLCDCTAGAITATLYSSPGDGAMHQVVVQKTDAGANAVTVTDGTFSFTLSARYDTVTCQMTSAGVWFGTSGFDSAGTGDFEGPSSSTNGDLVTFSGSTGKIGADSGIVATTLSSTASIAVVNAATADSKAVSAGKGSPLGTVVVSATSVVSSLAGATVALMECWGAGGGGGGVSAAANSAGAGGGGGGGGYSAKWILSGLAASYSIGVGASGASGAANAGTGGTGGSTLISTVISAAGGLGGVGMAADVVVIPALGGSGGAVTTGGDLNYAGNPGAGGLRCSGTSAIGGNGAATRLQGAGKGASSDAVGGDAAANTGAGGGGAAANAATSRTGGAGGSGVAIITFYR